MPEPVVLRVTRPYANEDEYLQAEAWAIDDKSILLVDQPSLPRDTLLRFEVVLEDGSRPIRAEGKVMRMVPATASKPGGLKVRFRRFGASTKAFIDRVMAARKKERRMSKRPQPQLLFDPEDIEKAVESASERPPPPKSEPAPSQSEPAPPRAADSGLAESVPAESLPAEPVSTGWAPAEPVGVEPVSAEVPSVESDQPAPMVASQRFSMREDSGVHKREPVPPPPNRDELLDRLRERAQRLAKAKSSEPDQEDGTG